MQKLIAALTACTLALGGLFLHAPAAQAQSVPPVSDKQYVLRFGDALNLRVVENEKLQMDNQPIRPDGRISMPLIGEIQAGGLTLPQLSERVAKAYGKFFVDPHVVINVARFRPLDINVVGMVNKPGTYQVPSAVRLMHAIALGGGFSNERADLTNVILLRDNGTLQKIDVTQILEGKVENNVLVYDGDTVRVGEVSSPDWKAILPPVAQIASVLGTVAIIWWRLDQVAK